MNRMISPFGFLHFLQEGLQTLFELSAEARPRDERSHVERDDALGLQRLRNIPFHDPVGNPFGDGGLADARFADEHGVVLRPAREHLQHAPDLLVAADDRIHLPFAGKLVQIAPVALQGLVFVLGVLVGDPLVPADLLQHGVNRPPW